MSFVSSRRLISTLSTLSILTALAFGCPGLDCLAINQARQAPVYITTTKPCDGCHHEPTSPHQQSITTITSRQCSSKSAVPYTSGSSTFWLSTPSCPSQPTVTSWMTQNGTCAAPQSAVTGEFRNISLQAHGLDAVFKSPVYIPLRELERHSTLSIPGPYGQRRRADLFRYFADFRRLKHVPRAILLAIGQHVRCAEFGHAGPERRCENCANLPRRWRSISAYCRGSCYTCMQHGPLANRRCTATNDHIYDVHNFGFANGYKLQGM